MHVEELNRQIEQIIKLRSEEDELSGQKRLVTNELVLQEGKLLDMLEAAGLKSFKSPHGLVSRSFRQSVKIPRTEEERKLFFDFLKEKGLYDKMISVNSQTLNAFYKDEFEQAKERGEGDFNIPGIKEVTLTPILSLRKT